MTLRMRFWGTRGSIPSPGAATVRYGGNTPCVELRTVTDRLVVLDAGTGIRELGRALLESSNGKPIRGDLFLTHAHWDHIQGIPFFGPIFNEGNEFNIWRSTRLAGTVDRVVKEQMSPVVFPVSFDQVGATIHFCEVGQGLHQGDGYQVQAIPVRHPGGALGYRFFGSEVAEGGLVYISDNELGVGGGDDSAPDWRNELVGFIRGADVLVHDTMYTKAEYQRHQGWGHSTYEEAVDLALESEVATLVLFHHRPERSDDEVDGCLAACRAEVVRRGGRLEVVAAAEGMTLTVEDRRT
jgi:phosphoribosyl 1,2-cyclic phosphodiesterase